LTTTSIIHYLCLQILGHTLLIGVTSRQPRPSFAFYGI
jgi:hypothetical protein